MVRGGSETQPNLPNSKGLVVGNYCHDVLIRDNTKIAETLGGAASFVSNILDGLSIQCDYISRVGSDFAYTVPHLPITNPNPQMKTTLFKAYFSSIPDRDGNRDRILKRIHGCDPILPSDIPDEQFQFGLAVGVAGEISPETLQRMIDLCRIVFVDIQALIRVFDPVDGTVKHVNLKESGFFHLLPKIGFLKASSEEAPYVDVEEARKWCCVVVTDGKDGCRVYWKDGEMQISPFPTMQVDPTGAGDSFLGALVAGLNWGLTVPDAALLGNFFGSLTVGQIGLPKFQLWLLQRVKDELLKRKEVRGGQCELTTLGSEFRKSADHEDLQASLAMAANKLRASHHNNSDQNSDEHVVKGKGMPDNCNNGEQNTDEHVLKGKIMHNNCNKGEHKLLVNGLNEEPVHSIEDQT